MKLEGKKALITGITGTVAGPIAVRLRDAGVHVRALVRKRDQAKRVEELGFEPVLGELGDDRSLASALEGVTLVVNAAAYLGKDADLARIANVEGVAALSELALAEGVERFLHISTLYIYGSPSSGDIDEAYPLLPYEDTGAMGVFGPLGPYATTKAEGERVLAGVAAKGLPAVVLRPGAVGGEDSHWGNAAIRLIASLPDFVRDIGLFHPNDLVAWIHVENLADMALLVTQEDAAIAQAYHAVDGNFAAFESLQTITEVFGKTLIPADRDPVRPVFAHDKIRRLGYEPRRSFEESAAALLSMARELAAARPSRSKAADHSDQRTAGA